MQSFHPLPSVSGSTHPMKAHHDLPVPVKPLPKPHERKIPHVPVEATHKKMATKPIYGMTLPVMNIPKPRIDPDYRG